MKLAIPKKMDEAHFDITPMVDLVLLLIIFFMLTSQFAQAERRQMDLPREKGASSQEESKDLIVIDVDGGGKFHVFNRRMDLEQLAVMIEGELKRRGDPEGRLDLVVRAARTSTAAELNRLADTLARLGVRTWKLATSAEGAGE